MEKVVQIKNLAKRYGALKAVDDISFEVEAGTIFGLLGHNGAGKTTTIECLLGTKSIDGGSIKVFGQDPTKNRKQLFQDIGVQFQQSAYQSKLKVKEICEINQSLYKETSSWKELLKSFHLFDKKNAYIASLSGGERQKLDILLAIMHRPKLVFLDELTTGLDPKARREVWEYILELKAAGVSVLLTSHFMDEVEYLCDQIAILQHGKILVSGTVNEVILASGEKNMEEAFLYYAKEEDEE